MPGRHGRHLGDAARGARRAGERTRRPMHGSALRSLRRRRGRPAGTGGRSGDRRPRHPGQQCRPHPRRAVRAHVGRGLEPGHRRQPDRGVQALARRAAGHDAAPHGRIISISSVVAATGNAGQGNYAASKAGLIGMTKSLAQEVASRGITVNCIAPGFVASAMTDALNDKQQESILAARAGEAPRHRRGDRRRGGLSGERRGRLRHRTNDPRQWRYGHDLKGENRADPFGCGGVGEPPPPLVKVRKVC